MNRPPELLSQMMCHFTFVTSLSSLFTSATNFERCVVHQKQHMHHHNNRLRHNQISSGVCHTRKQLKYRTRLKGSPPGLVNFITALAYHFCLALPAVFTQPGGHLLAEPYIASSQTAAQQGVSAAALSTRSFIGKIGISSSLHEVTRHI